MKRRHYDVRDGEVPSGVFPLYLPLTPERREKLEKMAEQLSRKGRRLTPERVLLDYIDNFLIGGSGWIPPGMK